MASFDAKVVEKVSNALVGQKVSFKSFPAEIIGISPSPIGVTGSDIMVKIKLLDGSEKSLALMVAKNSGALVFENEIGNEIWALIKHGLNEYSEQLKEEEIERKEAAKLREAKRKEVEAEAKRQKRIDKILAGLEESVKNSTYSATNDFYYNLGWLTKNARYVKAEIPEFAVRWFQKVFGNVPFKEIDSTRKTTGGYSMKWNPSFRLGVSSKVTVPAGLTDKFNGTQLNSVSFIYQLVNDFDFEFTDKPQDLNRIIANVPANYQANFMAGYYA